MNIIAIPDLHLDKNFNVTYGDSKIWARKPLELIKSILDKENPDKVIFLGDIFNTCQPSYHSVFKFLQAIDGYEDCSVLAGNHDIPKTKVSSVMDYISDYMTVVQPNQVLELHPTYYGIGWCDTQDLFEEKLSNIIIQDTCSIVFVHGAYNNWENEMDNVVTDQLIKLAKANNVKIISGHEHISKFRKDTLYHLGSIMPMNIGELGKKYYWSSVNGFVEINHKVGSTLDNDVVLIRKEVDPQGDKPVYIKKNKEVSADDIKMEAKELDVDILEDFKKEAESAGFDNDFIKELIP